MFVKNPCRDRKAGWWVAARPLQEQENRNSADGGEASGEHQLSKRPNDHIATLAPQSFVENRLALDQVTYNMRRSIFQGTWPTTRDATAHPIAAQRDDGTREATLRRPGSGISPECGHARLCIAPPCRVERERRFACILTPVFANACNRSGAPRATCARPNVLYWISSCELYPSGAKQHVTASSSCRKVPGFRTRRARE